MISFETQLQVQPVNDLGLLILWGVTILFGYSLTFCSSAPPNSHAHVSHLIQTCVCHKYFITNYNCTRLRGENSNAKFLLIRVLLQPNYRSSVSFRTDIFKHTVHLNVIKLQQ